jgi:hypothetical protein
MANPIESRKKRMTAARLGVVAFIVLSACRFTEALSATPTLSFAESRATQNAIQSARLTQEAKNTPIPTYPSNQQEAGFANDQKLCAPVKADGSIVQAITDANGGHFPTNQVFEYIFSVTHDGQVTIGPASINSTLKGGAHEKDIVYPGDGVCISVTGEILRTPFPQNP